MGLQRQSAAESATDQARDNQRRNRMRKTLLSRHTAQSVLEEKSGVIKLRVDPISLSGVTQTAFGLAKSHRVSKRCRSLSRPKAQYLPRDPLNYAELKGLLVVEYPSAIAKVKRSVSNIHSHVQMEKDEAKPVREGDIEGKEAMVAIDQFQSVSTSKGFCGKDLEAVFKPVEESGRTRLARPTG